MSALEDRLRAQFDERTRRRPAQAQQAAALREEAPRRWGLQARKSRSGGRPLSEVSRAGTDGVRIRPWANRETIRSVRTHSGQGRHSYDR